MAAEDERPKADIYLYIEEEDGSLRAAPSPCLLKNTRVVHIYNASGEEVHVELEHFSPEESDVPNGQIASFDFTGGPGVTVERYSGVGKSGKKLKGQSGPKIIVDI